MPQGLEPQSALLFKTLERRDKRLSTDPSAEEKRAVFGRSDLELAPPRREVARVHELAIPSGGVQVPVRVYHPRPDKALPVVVWFHGGGHVVGDLQTHDTLCRTIALDADCAVVNVDYRLAPENPYPAAFDDAYAAACWASGHGAEFGFDTGAVMLGGSSAGGGLAAAVALAARDRRGPPIKHHLMVYPTLDATLSSDTYRTYASGYSYTTAKRSWSRDQYVGGHKDLKDPYLSPLWAATVERLPPAHIITAELDPLRGESEAYARRLIEAGVAVRITRYAGVMHGFFSQSGVLDRGKAAVAEACAGFRGG